MSYTSPEESCGHTTTSWSQTERGRLATIGVALEFWYFHAMLVAVGGVCDLSPRRHGGTHCPRGLWIFRLDALKPGGSRYT